jgi:predicted RNase H-like HicB family nuclease
VNDRRRGKREMDANGRENAEHGVFPQIVSPLTLLRMKLRLVLEHDSETNRWAAFFPELPGCASAGDSEEEAVRNAKEALELWFKPSPLRISNSSRL